MPKLDRTLTLKRDGEFTIHTTGDSHCGTFTNGELTVKYHLNCICESTIDKRGFLFEQVSVDNFFKNMKRTTMSCEKLTISCAKKLVTLIHKDNPVCRIRSIDLTLSPYPHAASMTYSVQPKG